MTQYFSHKRLFLGLAILLLSIAIAAAKCGGDNGGTQPPFPTTPEGIATELCQRDLTGADVWTALQSRLSQNPCLSNDPLIQRKLVQIPATACGPSNPLYVQYLRSYKEKKINPDLVKIRKCGAATKEILTGKTIAQLKEVFESLNTTLQSEDCAGSLAGTVPVGGICTSTMECQGTSSCKQNPANFLELICTARKDSCINDEDCGKEEKCSSNKKCVSAASFAVHEALGYAIKDGDDCTLGPCSICHACVKASVDTIESQCLLPALDSRCATYRECLPNFYCSGVGRSSTGPGSKLTKLGTCKPRPTSGMCFPSRTNLADSDGILCAEGYECRKTTCQKKASLNESCKEISCAQGLTCIDGLCLSATGAENSPCGDDEECDPLAMGNQLSPLFCSSNKCTAKKAGSDCVHGSNCSFGEKCKNANKDTKKETCEPSGGGSFCPSGAFGYLRCDSGTCTDDKCDATPSALGANPSLVLLGTI